MNAGKLTTAFMCVALIPLACSPDGGNENGDNVNGNVNGNDNGGGSVVLPDSFDKSGVTVNGREVEFDEADRLIVDDEIEGANDVDVYDLGPLSLGDQIDVLCIATGLGTLDPMIALFDADGYRIFWNDDINPGTSNFDSAFFGDIRHDSPNYFLAVTSYPGDFGDTSGTYRLTVQLEPGAAVAKMIGQTVVLHFAFAPGVTVDQIDRGDLPEFDAATVDPAFAGLTQEMKDLIVQIVSDDYAPYGVDLLTTDDEQPQGNFSTLFYGVLSEQSLFGIADDVDFYNGSDQDNAIVFIAEFGGLSSNMEAVTIAIANVSSHEIGHGLGLMHTADDTTLMDTVGSEFSLLEDQSFGVADLYDFPIGLQNAPLLLEETVGLAGKTKYGFDQDGKLRCGTCGATLWQVSGMNRK